MPEDDPNSIELDALEKDVREPWVVVMAERDDAGEWRTVGEPLAREQFHDLDLAFTFANALNRRDFGQKFDWLANPPRAWLAVRPGQLGALRVNQPAVAPQHSKHNVGSQRLNGLCCSRAISGQRQFQSCREENLYR